MNPSIKPDKVMKKMTIIDNTLREGEQTPGVAFTIDEKLEVVRALSGAGVTLFDAAFPESSEQERKFVKVALSEVPEARIGASCRLLAGSMENAVKCGAKELFVIVPVSDLHLEKRLKISRAGQLGFLKTELAAFGGGADVNIVLEDAFRGDADFVIECMARACDYGAARIFLADTVGMVHPLVSAGLVRRARETVPAAVEIGTHYHNDLGLALANTLFSVEAGATCLTAAVNGLGERAGNTDIAQLCAAATLLSEFGHSVDMTKLRRISALVESKTGILVSQTAPITGYNAFRHTSGIHVHGMLEDPRTYEAVDPVMFNTSSELVLGKHSGRRHVRSLMASAGINGKFSEEALLAEIKDASHHPGKKKAAAELLDLYSAFNERNLGLSEAGFLELVKEKNCSPKDET